MPTVDPQVTKKKISILKKAIRSGSVTTVEEGRTVLQRRFGSGLRNQTIREMISKTKKKGILPSKSKYLVVASSTVMDSTNNKKVAASSTKELISSFGYGKDEIAIYQRLPQG